MISRRFTASILELHVQGLRVIMATGDNERTARAVAGRLGIDEVRAGVLPEAQKDLIDQLRRDSHKIAMTGGGVNDAPALAGVAMGACGAAASAEAADIVLLVDRIDRLGPGIEIARASRRIAVESVVAGIGLSVSANVLNWPCRATT